MSISSSVVDPSPSAKISLAFSFALLVRLSPLPSIETSESSLLFSFPLDRKRLLGPGENRLFSSSSPLGSSSASASASLAADLVRGRRRFTSGVGSLDSLSDESASWVRDLLDVDLDMRRVGFD